MARATKEASPVDTATLSLTGSIRLSRECSTPSVPSAHVAAAWSRGCNASGSAAASTADHQENDDIDGTRATQRKKKRRRGPQLYSIKKERAVEFNLQLDINDLKQQISTLMARKQLLHSLQLRSISSVPQLTPPSHRVDVAPPPPPSATTITCAALPPQQLDDAFFVHVAREYTQVFARGASQAQHGRQHSFLASAMAPCVLCGKEELDVDQLWANHLAYEEVLPLVAIDSLRSIQLLRVESDTLVKARGCFRAIITRKTLEQVFPHILSDEFIVSRLVGRTSEWNCTWEFLFDAHGRVTRFNVDLDVVRQFTDLLGSPKLANLLLDGSLLHQVGALLNGWNGTIEADECLGYCAQDWINKLRKAATTIADGADAKEAERLAQPSHLMKRW